MLRRLALNMLWQDQTETLSLRRKRLKAGWDNDYLASMRRPCLRTSFFERTSCRGASRVSFCRMFPLNVSTSSRSREREPLPLGYGITKLAVVSAAALPDEELRARRGHARP